MPDVRMITAKRILTRQKGGFLTEGPYPYTHTLSWAVGCGFGSIYCGQYCYASAFPNWLYNKQPGEQWGDAVILKENAPELLDAELAKAKNRHEMRIFMSSVTDPYQPLERRYRLTRRCLDVFAQYRDLDLLIIQTRSPLVIDDIDRIAAIPYAWLSMTLETDRGDLPYGPSANHVRQRLEAVTAAARAGCQVQITVSPCMPYTPDFADLLAASGAQRVVVDTFVDGDGSQGHRTAASPFAEQADYNWRATDPARALYESLRGRGLAVGWSAAGFGGIPPRQHVLI
ncbi:radical SAM protein [Phototrophicus methaneseepsis]|uniref:Radical SAM protein n=1 Tax=Phototrophicus methaneseepsis TaxID=2710758 RepID=A0A7S8IG10_9CHLR|nr:radical SAM protein [Phototrophicus methaneseepsis]QPC83488.1 radical SAM protein [Phototrophicus methaneseepsis]